MPAVGGSGRGSGRGRRTAKQENGRGGAAGTGAAASTGVLTQGKKVEKLERQLEELQREIEKMKRAHTEELSQLRTEKRNIFGEAAGIRRRAAPRPSSTGRPARCDAGDASAARAAGSGGARQRAPGRELARRERRRAPGPAYQRGGVARACGSRGFARGARGRDHRGYRHYGARLARCDGGGIKAASRQRHGSVTDSFTSEY